jgi:LmbE family N-acetylglucosaminyl deacetylase
VTDSQLEESLPPHMPVRPLRFILRYTLLGAAMPCVYFIGVTLAFCYRERAANAAYASLRLPPAPAPTHTTRLMVFAPHCDDETLGCAGLIQQTLASGGSAQAVMLTNGDGFRTAVECQAHSMHIGPGDYIRFAALRQEESYRALANLGLGRDEVHFLGYPDRGLQSLWYDYWTPDRCYVSTFTHCDHSPYPNTFRPGAAYCGQSLLADIEANLRAFRPTLIAVTHPAEDHVDHAAAAVFVARALQELQADPRQRVWAAHTRLVYYLVHRGDWPSPPNESHGTPLAPPASMAHGETHWMSLPLTPAQTARKLQSIDLYPSQTAMMARFLHAFARSTETFGELPTDRLVTVADGAMDAHLTTHAWDALPPVMLDPVRDDIVRDLNGGADIRAVYACRDSRNLYVRLDCREALHRRYTYTILLRAFGPQGGTESRALLLHLRPANTKTGLRNGVRAVSQGGTLAAVIPLPALLPTGTPLATLGMAVETALPGGMLVDKTGVRLLIASDVATPVAERPLSQIRLLSE